MDCQRCGLTNLDISQRCVCGSSLREVFSGSAMAGFLLGVFCTLLGTVTLYALLQDGFVGNSVVWWFLHCYPLMLLGLVLGIKEAVDLRRSPGIRGRPFAICAIVLNSISLLNSVLCFEIYFYGKGVLAIWT